MWYIVNYKSCYLNVLVSQKEVGNLDFFSLFFLNVATAELLWLSLFSIWKIRVSFLTLHLLESFDKISSIRPLFLILKVIPCNLIISKWAGWNIGNETRHARSAEKIGDMLFVQNFFIHSRKISEIIWGIPERFRKNF